MNNNSISNLEVECITLLVTPHVPDSMQFSQEVSQLEKSSELQISSCSGLFLHLASGRLHQSVCTSQFVHACIAQLEQLTAHDLAKHTKSLAPNDGI